VARSEHHDRLSPEDKSNVYKVAYSNVKNFIEDKNYIAANVLAFALLEERVLAAYVGCTMAKNKSSKPNHQETSKKKFGEVVKNLKELCVIDDDLGHKLVNAADERNRRTHEMIWRLQSFTKSSAETYVRLSKKVSNEHNKFLTKQRRQDSATV